MHNCSMCSFFSNDRNDFISHVIRRHRHDKNFIIHCSHAACGASFINLNSFKSHASRVHGICIDADADTSSVTIDSSSIEHCTESRGATNSSAEAAYILSLRARHRLSQSAIEDVCASTKELFRAKVNGCCSGSSESFSDSLFAGLETRFKQEKFFVDHFGLVRPHAQKIGTLQATVNKGDKHLCAEKDVTGYYVPLKEQLQALLSMPEVQSYFDTVPQETPFVYDICDAPYITNHCMNTGPATLKLCLYTDEFEIVNPIGTHRKKHKLTAFYWTLLNIPAEFRSKLSAIQLLALAKTKDLRRFGSSSILQDFVATLNQLQDGIALCIEGVGVKTFTGFLACCLADTPAAQLIGGFKEGVGCAVSPCRSCDAKHADLAQIFTAAECPMRDTNEHAERVAHLQSQNRQGFEYWSKRWGVNGPSVLSVPGFDVTKCILHDPMHLILLGSASVELKAVLRIFINEKKYFTLDTFNRAIQQYSFSPEEVKDKPEVIDKKALQPSAVFPQTAAAMKNLLVNFPFIIADRIPDNDEHWHNFLLLLQILMLSISPVISVQTANTLEALVAAHNKKFVQLYSEQLFTPKFHYLVHLPQQMRLFGPLRNHWCMRFEAKNGFFKMQRWFNFRNLPKSLSFFHQNWMCLQMIQTAGCRSTVYLYSGDKVSEGMVMSVKSLPEMNVVLEADFGSEKVPSNVMCSQHVVINGINYRKGTVLLESSDIVDVRFVEVETVVVHEQVKYLYCRLLDVLLFDSHRNAFRVQRSENFVVRRISQVHYRWPQVVYHHRDGFFVSLQNADDAWSL